MFLNNLVAAIKTNGGKTLREASIQTQSSNNYPFDATRSGVVYLPFDSEYSIYLKNSSNCRCAIEVSIDGTDVLGGHKLVIQPNDTLDLERFILDGDLSKGKRFKFVTKDHPEVQNPGSSENGFITIKAQWEKLPPYYVQPISWTWCNMFGPHYHPGITGSNPQFFGTIGTPDLGKPYAGDPLPGQEPTNISYNQADNKANMFKSRSVHINSVQCCSDSFQVGSVQSFHSAPVPTAGQIGATVEGSESYQSFGTTTLGEMNPQIITMRFQMLAPKNDTPYTVRDTKSKYCHKCGLQLSGNANYCPKCGTKQEFLV